MHLPLATTQRQRGWPRGFTFIELLTAGVVLAVIVAVAIPSYKTHRVHTQRAGATAALLQVQAAQQKFYLLHNRYTADITPPPPRGLGLAARDERGVYQIAIVLGTDPAGSGDQSYTATARAVPSATQATDMECTTFTLTDTGRRGATGTGEAISCWR